MVNRCWCGSSKPVSASDHHTTLPTKICRIEPFRVVPPCRAHLLESIRDCIRSRKIVECWERSNKFRKRWRVVSPWRLLFNLQAYQWYKKHYHPGKNHCGSQSRNQELLVLRSVRKQQGKKQSKSGKISLPVHEREKPHSCISFHSAGKISFRKFR